MDAKNINEHVSKEVFRYLKDQETKHKRILELACHTKSHNGNVQISKCDRCGEYGFKNMTGIPAEIKHIYMRIGELYVFLCQSCRLDFIRQQKEMTDVNKHYKI